MPEPRFGWVLYDSAFQSPWLSELIHLDESPLSWDLTLLLPDRTTVVGANVYRQAMRRVWWAHPLYLLSIAPGLNRIFNWSYSTFARNRYCVSRACGLDGATNVRR